MHIIFAAASPLHDNFINVILLLLLSFIDFLVNVDANLRSYRNLDQQDHLLTGIATPQLFRRINLPRKQHIWQGLFGYLFQV
jgi:hypothetical protein